MQSNIPSELVAIVKVIASAEYQNATWMGGDGTVVSSPDEVFCGFFDDCSVELLLQESPAEHGMTAAQHAQFRELAEAMRAYSDSTPRHLDPEVVLSDPRWAEMRLLAKMFLDTLNEGG